MNIEEASLKTTRYLYYQAFNDYQKQFQKIPYHHLLKRFRDTVGSYYVDYCELLFSCEPSTKVLFQKEKLGILMAWLELSRAYLGSESAYFLVVPLYISPQCTIYPSKLYHDGHYFECFLLAKNPIDAKQILDTHIKDWRTIYPNQNTRIL